MMICQISRCPPFWRTVQKPVFQQIWLHHVLDGPRVLSDGGAQGVQAHRPYNKRNRYCVPIVQRSAYIVV